MLAGRLTCAHHAIAPFRRDEVEVPAAPPFEGEAAGDGGRRDPPRSGDVGRGPKRRAGRSAHFDEGGGDRHLEATPNGLSPNTWIVVRRASTVRGGRASRAGPARAPAGRPRGREPKA